MIDEKTILAKRAKELARVNKPEDRGEYLSIILFTLANEEFGIEDRIVKEVIPLKDLTPLPGVPAFVAGIINVRGNIISILDLKRFFDMPDPVMTDLTRVIILKNEEMELGIIAEKVVGTGRAYLNEMQKTLPTLKGIREDYLKGITNNRVVILDYEKLLNDERIVINEKF